MLSEDQIVACIRKEIWRQVADTKIGYPYVGGEPDDTGDGLTIDGEINIRELAQAILKEARDAI